jgi:hypothetical protein
MRQLFPDKAAVKTAITVVNQYNPPVSLIITFAWVTRLAVKDLDSCDHTRSNCRSFGFAVAESTA